MLTSAQNGYPDNSLPGQLPSRHFSHPRQFPACLFLPQTIPPLVFFCKHN